MTSTDRGLEVRLTVAGEPGATVEVIVDGAVKTSSVVDDSGALELVFPVTFWEVILSNAEVRYIVGDQVGPGTAIDLWTMFRENIGVINAA